jgi:hypothetical protein
MIKRLIRKVQTLFTGTVDVQKIYDDTYNAKLLRQAHEEIYPGILSRTTYFAGEWLMYAIAIALAIAAYYFSGIFDEFLVGNCQGKPEVGVASFSDDKKLVLEWTALLFMLLPAVIVFILARVMRAKQKHMDRLADIAQKIDEVAGNLEYRVKAEADKMAK